MCLTESTMVEKNSKMIYYLVFPFDSRVFLIFVQTYHESCENTAAPDGISSF